MREKLYGTLTKIEQGNKKKLEKSIEPYKLCALRKATRQRDLRNTLVNPFFEVTAPSVVKQNG